MLEIESCPFCGGVVRYIRLTAGEDESGFGDQFLHCDGCNCSFDFGVIMKEDELIKIFNSRDI